LSRIVVDTDVASYIFNWHSAAKGYVEVLRGSELILSFMSVAEMRLGAMAAGWGVRRRNLLEQFLDGFGIVYTDGILCTAWATVRVRARAAGWPLSPQDAWIAATALVMDAPLATKNRADSNTLRGFDFFRRDWLCR
jgi:tRNA(fMet)-specific endonuclease VapC